VTVRQLVEHELLTLPGFNTGVLCGVQVVQSLVSYYPFRYLQTYRFYWRLDLLGWN